MSTAERLWSPINAFNHPVTFWITLSVAVTLLIAPILIVIFQRLGFLSETTHRELVLRWKSWILISGSLIIPILLGAGPVFVLGLILSLLCYREYARATGLFREHSIHSVVILGLFLVHFAAADHYYRLFVAALRAQARRPATLVRVVARGHELGPETDLRAHPGSLRGAHGSTRCASPVG